MRNLILLIGATAVLASCDKPKDAEGSKDDAASNSRARRLERPPIEDQGTRGRLRAALESAKAIETPDDREEAIAQVGREAVEPAPDITAEAIRELPLESPNAAELIQACVANLMLRSTDEASRWADSLGDEARISLARGQMAVTLAESEPERAIQLLADSGPALVEPGSAMEQVLQIWTVKAPADAAAWASKLPAGESRNAGIKSVVSQWIQSDPAASTSWVASLADANLRQESIRNMAESFQGIPPFLLDSVLQNADPGVRAEIEKQIAQDQPAQGEGMLPGN